MTNLFQIFLILIGLLTCLRYLWYGYVTACRYVHLWRTGEGADGLTGEWEDD